jgi:hypothetical protein
VVLKHSLHGDGWLRATLKSKSSRLSKRRVLVSLMAIYSMNVRPQGRRQTWSLILKGLLEEELEVL